MDAENGSEDREVGGIFFTVDMVSKKVTVLPTMVWCQCRR